MITTQFTEAVDQIFPQLDENTRTDIKEKVTMHMLEFLRGELYSEAKQVEEWLTLLDNLNAIDDIEERSKQYSLLIMNKLNSLSAVEQKILMEKFNSEQTRVMHEIYIALQ